MTNTDRDGDREEFRGYVFDSRTQAPIRGVTVQVQLPDGMLETTTDEAGFYSLNVEAGATYLIMYNKYGYTDAVVRTVFSYNSNSRIAPVNLDKSYDYPTLDKFNGYSIQLAAMPEKPSDARLRSYEPLTKIANLYIKYEGKMNKIRLGIFPTLTEAEDNLKKVLKDKNYKASFVVEERGADETLILGNENIEPVRYSTITDVRYAIQLGSFAAGKSISISDYTGLNGLGNLYSKSENRFTKVRLGVWGEYAHAEGAKAEAIRLGFPNAIIITERADDPSIRDFMMFGYILAIDETKIEKLRKGSSATAPIVYSSRPATTLITFALLCFPNRKVLILSP